MRWRPSPLPTLIQVRLDGQLSSLLSVVVLPLLEQIERDVGRQGAMFTEQVATLKDEVCTHIRTYVHMYVFRVDKVWHNLLWGIADWSYTVSSLAC